MFSGKTEELIRRLRRARTAKKSVQVFKPVIDSRYSTGEIVTHGNRRMQAEAVDSAQEIFDKLEPKTDVVGIDEANLFGLALVGVATALRDADKQVTIAGLDTDYLGRPFPPVPELLALADSITKLLAICSRCGAPANHSQRLVDSKELILVGAVDSYEARCRRCFEPGLPLQEVLDFVAAAGKIPASD